MNQFFLRNIFANRFCEHRRMTSDEVEPNSIFFKRIMCLKILKPNPKEICGKSLGYIVRINS